jgi:hypothetical protein
MPSSSKRKGFLMGQRNLKQAIDVLKNAGFKNASLTHVPHGPKAKNVPPHYGKKLIQDAIDETRLVRTEAQERALAEAAEILGLDLDQLL